MDFATTLIGQTLGGRYRLVAVLGRGGAGTVYEAIQEDLGRRVAIKVLHIALAADPAWARRMEREARSTAVLDHPNIVQVTDFQVTPGGLPYLVMERLAGGSLRQLIEREAPLAPARVVHITLQALSALDAAHRAGIIHRDVKPENLFVTTTPAVADFVKVLDFGIATGSAGFQSATTVTQAGAVLGTHGYMAPEQSRGEPVDARTDLFAVGACMYEALAGREASGDARTSGATGAGFAGTRVPSVPLRERRPDLDPRLCAIVARALENDPARRFGSAQEMMDALRAIGPGMLNVSITPARHPNAEELAPTAAGMRPLHLSTSAPAPPLAQTFHAPSLPAPAPPLAQTFHHHPPSQQAQTSRAPWFIGGGLIVAVLLLGTCAGGGALAFYALRSGAEVEPAPIASPPPPSSTAPTILTPSVVVDSGAAAPRLTRPRSSLLDGGGVVVVVDAAAPPAPPRPEPPPSPPPSPPPPRPTSDEPWKNPPPLDSATATVVSLYSIDDPAMRSGLEGFVRQKVAPMAQQCFRTIGFQFQAGKEVWSQVQFTIHADAHIDSFVMHASGGAERQSDCVEAMLRATSAPNLCNRTKPPSCTLVVKLAGKYR